MGHSDTRREIAHPCQPRPHAKAAIYTKEAAGYPGGENSKELQLHHCEKFCQYHDLEIIARYHDPADVRTDFEWMMGEATQDDPPFEYIVVYKLRNFSWSLRRDRPVPGQAERPRRHPHLHHGEFSITSANQLSSYRHHYPTTQGKNHPKGKGTSK